jgi:hypothetical protein
MLIDCLLLEKENMQKKKHNKAFWDLQSGFVTTF